MFKSWLHTSAWLVVGSCLMSGTSASAATAASGGDKLANDGNYAAAAAAFAADLKAAPADAETMAKLAQIDQLRGQFEPAVAWARRAIAAAPSEAKYQLLLGDALSNYVHDVSVFRQLGIAHEIRDAYRQAVQLAPHDANARFSLAMFYLVAPGIAGGSSKDAAIQIQTLATEDAASADLARAQQALGDKQEAQAETLYRQAATAAKDSSGYIALGQFLLRRKQPADALAAFEQATKAYPREPNAYYYIGKLASEGKAPAEAGIAALDTYLGLAINWQNGDPPYCWAHYRLGLIHARTGNAAKASAEYAQALQLDPDFKQARQALKS